MATGPIKAGEAFVRVFSDDAPLVRGIKGIEAKYAKLGASVGRIGAGLATAGAAVVGTVGSTLGGIGTIFAGFDSRMAEVAAVSGTTGDALAALRDQAKELGSTTKFSATEAAEAMKFLGMAGMNSTQILSAVGPVLNVAAAGMLDLGRAADIVSDATTAFGLSAEETARVADVMAKTATSSNTSIEQMGEAFIYAAAQGKAAGQSIEDVSAALGILGNAGLKASIAGSGVQGMFKRMVSPKTGQFFAELGIQVSDSAGRMRSLTDIVDQLRARTQAMTQVERLKKFEQLFGLHAKTAVILTDNADALRTMTHNLKGAQGAAAEMAGVMSKSLLGSFLGLKSAAEGVVLALGEAFKGPMTAAIEIGTKLARTMTEIIDRNRGFVTGIGGAAVVVGVLAAGVTAAGVAVIGLGAAISGVATVAGALGSVIAAVGAPTLAIAAGIAVQLTALGAAVAYVADQTGLLRPALAFVGNAFGRLWDTASKAIGGIANALKSGEWALAAKIAWAGIKLASLQGAQSVLQGVEFLWNNATALTLKFLGGLANMIGKAFASLPRIAIAALRGGASLANALQSVLAQSLTGTLDVSSSLDPIIAQQRKQMVSLNRQAFRGANPRGQATPARRPQVPQPPAGVAPRMAAARQSALTQPEAATRAVARTASVTARPAAPGGEGGLAALVGISQEQLIALRRLVQLGSLD